MEGKEILHDQILEKVGEGGMGAVCLAEDTGLACRVAIKFLPLHIASDSDEKERFEIEANASAADCLEISAQIASGLQTAHEKGIIHRDIKSANIMVTEKGQIKIIDFGLAKLAYLTKEQSTLGTAAYMSPEQARDEPVDHRTGIWSLGVVYYELLSGVLPFTGEYEAAIMYQILNEEPAALHHSRKDIPRDFENLIGKMLQRDRQRRTESIRQILAQLILKRTKKQSESGTIFPMDCKVVIGV